MNINRLSELDPYWIVGRYDGARTMAQFADCLHGYGVPRDDGVLVWKVLDAMADTRINCGRIAVDSGAVDNRPRVPPDDIRIQYGGTPFYTTKFQCVFCGADDRIEIFDSGRNLVQCRQCKRLAEALG